MLRGYKTEINPTKEQKLYIHKAMGTCRFVYNLFLQRHEEIYKKEERYLSGNEFIKWLNEVFIKENQEYNWIKEVSSKSIMQVVNNGDRAFKRFYNRQAPHPKFKKKNKSDIKLYFVRNTKDSIIKCERHRIKVPFIGWIRLKEKGYIPISNKGFHIISGTLSYKAGRYYVSVIIDMPDENKKVNKISDGLGIDLGIKDFAILSNGRVYKNINKTIKVRNIEKKIKREQRRLSRGKNKSNNFKKKKLLLQKKHLHLFSIRTDYINKIIDEIIKENPKYIVIENLKVSEMVKDKHLSKSIACQKFFEFRNKLVFKTYNNNIELRIANRWFPSSKICHNCGNIKKNLKLSDRIYECSCGYKVDRDFNAALNLKDCKDYIVA